MVVSLETQPSLKPGIPELLFEKTYRFNRWGRQYDIHPDGDSFLMIKEGDEESDPAQINIVLNWFEELKEKFRDEKQ